MALILHIETTTHVCSVALTRDGQLVSERENKQGRSHASLLSYFIGKILSETRLAPGSLDAISISEGPGSYTGLRIGVSTAKGLCYGADIPLLAVNTLRSLTQGLFARLKGEGRQPGENSIYVPMLEARRMEVYSAIIDSNNQFFRGVKAEVINENSFGRWLEKYIVYFFGNGSEKCREIIRHPNARFIEGVDLSAKHMASLAEEKYSNREFEDLAYFEPFYLKDFIATIPRKNILG
ncbi:MAG: tRNA (adenosine(37)-N6)-threonylcarbamoyltransferase complex dimerization subunit type 1 TsaB [Bacteroidales bacterium]|nr:tRNA (adenosine(37)-N6)-threonylcarbamoyltransferase complex dimerization subunit type 1 TsaB [Bacteroidales bacterium]